MSTRASLVGQQAFPLLRSLLMPPIGEPGHLDACFKFPGQTAGLDRDYLRGQPELIPHRRFQSLDRSRRIDAAPHFDRHHHDLEVAGGDQLGLEVADVGVAEDEILELRMIDVDAADLEETACAMGVFHQRKY